MSGGSFNYLCYVGIDDLPERANDIEEMVCALKETGYADDAAQATQAILDEVKEFQERLRVQHKSLTELWRAMEWWVSMDYNEEQFKNKLAEWRKQNASSETKKA